MKRLAIALVCTAGAAVAQAQTFIDTARVSSAEPQYENVTIPREECRNEWVTEPQRITRREPNYGGAVIGAVAGGVLGHQVGGGQGRDVATVLGAVVGAFAGDRIADNNYNNRYYDQPQPVSRQVARCQTVNEVQARLTGYRVAYEYHGQNYFTMMRENPGPRLQVRVSVDPVVR